MGLYTRYALCLHVFASDIMIRRLQLADHVPLVCHLITFVRLMDPICEIKSSKIGGVDYSMVGQQEHFQLSHTQRFTIPTTPSKMQRNLLDALWLIRRNSCHSVIIYLWLKGKGSLALMVKIFFISQQRNHNSNNDKIFSLQYGLMIPRCFVNLKYHSDYNFDPEDVHGKTLNSVFWTMTPYHVHLCLP